MTLDLLVVATVLAAPAAATAILAWAAVLDWREGVADVAVIHLAAALVCAVGAVWLCVGLAEVAS